MWSLGNEAGYGNAFTEMRKATHNSDPEKRLIQYADMNVAADMDSQTYPTIEWLKQHLQGKATRKGERGESTNEEQHGKYPSGRPFLLNEYAHAMGNSLGNFDDYWKLFYQNDMLAGGFVWDWVDQALYKNQENPTEGFVYGGDFADYPNNNNFCINGLIGADRIPHPHYYELQKVYQPVSIKLISKDPLTLEIENRQLATNLNDYDFSYEIIENGEMVSGGQLMPVDLAPLNKKEFNILNKIDYNIDKERFIKFRFSLKDDCNWAARGHVVAWEQSQLTEGKTKNNEISALLFPKGWKIETAEFLQIKGMNFSVKINKNTGLISEYLFDGNTIISSNVRFKNTQSIAEIRHTIYPDGKIQIDFEIIIPEKTPNIRRVGLQFEIAENMSDIDWYGRGPQENYLDRKSAAAIGIYHSTVNTWITPYVRPQENANRCDIRWMSFSSDDDMSLSFTADAKGYFSASSWPYTKDMLDKTTHDFELLQSERIVVNIDCAQMGVGGDNSWGFLFLSNTRLSRAFITSAFTFRVNN